MMDRDGLYKLFEESHRKGAERFGVDWLSVNIAAKSAADHMGLDASKLEMKTLLSLASYRFLVWMYNDSEAAAKLKADEWSQLRPKENNNEQHGIGG